MRIEPATAADAAACAAIYAPYVRDTAISFELDAPSADEVARRIAQAHEWLVARDDLQQAGQVVGYAYAGPWRTRPAYQWACEVSIYLLPAQQGRGVGRALYTALLDRLAARGFRTVLAGMTLPNPSSEALHHAMGFEPVGVERRIGFKLGAWHDVARVQRAIDDVSARPTRPPLPRSRS